MRLLFLLLFFSCFVKANSQSVDVNGALLVGVNLTLGNQNILFDLSLKGIGAVSYEDAALEAGARVYLTQIFKRHTIATYGLGRGYEVFALGGVGKNSNLLGASLFENRSTLIFDAQGLGGFYGLGFGFQREVLPGRLNAYTPRRGSLLMRFSNADHSIQVAFRNDFKFGNIINGQATDYASTGSLLVSYSSIQSLQQAHLFGLGLELFTPMSDHSKTPVNPINSDDGRKNVWFVLPPYEKLFFANLYGFGSYQDSYYSVSGSLGINSQKLGAYVQNTLHDSFGLNPRYPWDVRARDKVYYEFTGGATVTID